MGEKVRYGENSISISKHIFNWPNCSSAARPTCNLARHLVLHLWPWTIHVQLQALGAFHLQFGTSIGQSMPTSLHSKLWGHSMTWNSGRTIYSAILTRLPRQPHHSTWACCPSFLLSTPRPDRWHVVALLTVKPASGFMNTCVWKYGLFVNYGWDTGGGGGGGNLFHGRVDCHPRRHVLKSKNLPVLGKILTILWGRKDEGSGRFHCFHHKFLQKTVCPSYWFGSWTCWSIQHSTHTLQQDGLEAQMGCSCVPRIVLINMVVLLVHHTADQHQESFDILLPEAWKWSSGWVNSYDWKQLLIARFLQFFVLMCKSRYHSPPVVDDWLCANKASLWTIL